MRMLDLGIEKSNDESYEGCIELEQSNGPEDVSRILLHPLQIRLIAEHAGLLGPALLVPQPLVTEAHQRRVRALRDRITEFRDCEEFFNQLFDRCGSGPEMWQHIRAISDLADDIVADLDAVAEAKEEVHGQD